MLVIQLCDKPSCVISITKVRAVIFRPIRIDRKTLVVTFSVVTKKQDGNVNYLLIKTIDGVEIHGLKCY